MKGDRLSVAPDRTDHAALTDSTDRTDRAELFSDYLIINLGRSMTVSCHYSIHLVHLHS